MSDFDVAYISGQPLTTVISTNWAWIKLGYLYPKMWYNIDYYPPLGPRCWNMLDPCCPKGAIAAVDCRHPNTPGIQCRSCMRWPLAQAALRSSHCCGMAIWRFGDGSYQQNPGEFRTSYGQCLNDVDIRQPFSNSNMQTLEIPRTPSEQPMGWWCSNWH